MITSSDSFNTVDLGNYFAILPTAEHYTINDYCSQMCANRVPEGYAYNSGTNKEFLSVQQLRALIDQYLIGNIDN